MKSVLIGRERIKQAGCTLDDLENNRRQFETSLLNFIKNIFDLVPSSLESGLTEKMGIRVNEALVGVCGATSGVISCIQVAFGLCDLKMMV